MIWLLHQATRLGISCCLSLTLSGPLLADTIEVWLDDAHTRKVEVPELDPDQIADPSSFSLGFGKSLGQIGISIGWSHEKGVEYDKQAQKLIDEIRELCANFNDGQLSLESYHRRIRVIFSAIDQARLCRMELLVNSSIAAKEKGAKLDELLGLPPADTAAFKQKISGAMAVFRGQVEAIKPEEIESAAGSLLVDTTASNTYDRSRGAVARSLAELEIRVEAKPLRSGSEKRLVTIWADKQRTRRISVPALDVSSLVDDFEESLCVQMKFSAPLISQYVGPDVTYTLETKAKYNEAAQILIIKYRRLCLEYNSGLLSQEGYCERLVELMEAERMAFQAREQLAQRLNDRAHAMRDELARLLGPQSSSLADKLGKLKDKKRNDAASKLREQAGPSAVEEISREHREQMAAWDAFVQSVGEVAIEPPCDAIEVWVDDAMTRKVSVSTLDTDLLAQSVRTRLTLHISFFNFGPECGWAQERGLEYGHSAQQLIVKSKQLCMDYNAKLISQETFSRRSRQIDASVAQAAQVREALHEFYAELKGAARNELDRQLKLHRGR